MGIKMPRVRLCWKDNAYNTKWSNAPDKSIFPSRWISYVIDSLFEFEKINIFCFLLFLKITVGLIYVTRECLNSEVLNLVTSSEVNVQADDVAQGTAVYLSVTNTMSLKQEFTMYFLLESDRLGNHNRKPPKW